jgi:UDP-glucose 4-epimerase
MRSLKGKNILVTGGAGFIGSHLCDRLFYEGAHEVIVIDNMFLGNEENLTYSFKQGLILYKDDAEIKSSLEYIFNKHKINIVFNAATKPLNYSFINPSNAFISSVNIIINLLELQRKGLFESLCHFSTSEVYGTAVYEPMDENHPINPTTTYAGGKAAADIALLNYVKMFNLDAFIIRPFNNYGPRQNYKGQLAGIIPITIWKILNGLPPEIHGTGNQTRDFIDVFDTIDSIIQLFKIILPGDEVNISSNQQISMNELVEKICNFMEYDRDILYKDQRISDVECHNANNNKLKSLINFNSIDFDNGLKETINWYKNNV